MDVLNEYEKAYLAGAMDADGWFTVRRVAPKQGRITFGFFLLVGLGQTDPAVPTLLQQAYGGTVRVRQRRAAKGRKTIGWKPIYQWNAGPAASVRLIADLLPYLRVKRRQAELCLELQAEIDRWRYTWIAKGVKGATRLPDEAVLVRTRIFEELRSLHDLRITKPQLL